MLNIWAVNRTEQGIACTWLLTIWHSVPAIVLFEDQGITSLNVMHHTHVMNDTNKSDMPLHKPDYDNILTCINFQGFARGSIYKASVTYCLNTPCILWLTCCIWRVVQCEHALMYDLLVNASRTWHACNMLLLLSRMQRSNSCQRRLINMCTFCGLHAQTIDKLSNPMGTLSLQQKLRCCFQNTTSFYKWNELHKPQNSHLLALGKHGEGQEYLWRCQLGR